VLGKMVGMPKNRTAAQEGEPSGQNAAAAQRRLVVSWLLFPVAVLAGLAAVFGVNGRRRRRH
jgi:hypothetical protein